MHLRLGRVAPRFGGGARHLRAPLAGQRSPWRVAGHSHMRLGSALRHLGGGATGGGKGAAQDESEPAPMTMTGGEAVAAADDGAAARKPPPDGLRKWLGIYSELSKARLSALVVSTTSAGFLFAGMPMNW